MHRKGGVRGGMMGKIREVVLGRRWGGVFLGEE